MTTTRAGLSAAMEIAEKATRRAANARQFRARPFSLRVGVRGDLGRLTAFDSCHRGIPFSSRGVLSGQSVPSMPTAPSSPDRQSVSDETSAGRERECRRTDDQSEGRYGEKQSEATREAKPGEGARKQPLLLLQLESRVMRNAKPHQQIQARQWQDLAQIEHQHDRKDEYPDR